jgi:membrane protein implicated in regulation of membrane protease activity
MKKITPAMVVSWCLTASMVIAAVTPVLPPSAPEWLRQTLVIVAVIVAALTHSPLLSPQEPQS